MDSLRFSKIRCLALLLLPVPPLPVEAPMVGRPGLGAGYTGGGVSVGGWGLKNWVSVGRRLRRSLSYLRSDLTLYAARMRIAES